MRNKFKSAGLIPVSEILLDQKNYRLGPLDNQIECIDIMFEVFGPKIVKLAGHLIQEGLSPKPVVVSKDDSDRWVVREGNRRITALKVLNNPAMAPTDQYQRTFQNLRDTAPPNSIPNAIECLTADESTLNKYRELEHMLKKYFIIIIFVMVHILSHMPEERPWRYPYCLRDMPGK